ncbi:MAG: hypothetical protein ACEY3L_13400 [Wolbachia sp.]
MMVSFQCLTLESRKKEAYVTYSDDIMEAGMTSFSQAQCSCR